MRIVLINRFFFPDESATSRMATSLAFGLARRGWQVSAIASQTRHDGSAIAATRQIVDGVTVHRVRTSTYGRLRLIGRMADLLSFHVRAWRLMRTLSRDSDVVLVCTDPPLLQVTAALALWNRRAALVIWVMDLFPEAAIRLGVLRGDRLTTRLMLWLRDVAGRRARLNVSPTRSIAEPLLERGMPPTSLRVISHWSDGDAIRPLRMQDSQLRKDWGLEDRLVLAYSGNFGRAHEFGTILGAAERLRDHPEIVFLFVGDGARRAEIERAVQERGLTNVMMKPLQPRELLSDSLAAADIHLISLEPALETCCIPSKLYGILAAARPILFVGDRHGEVARIINAGLCGVSVAVGDSARLAGTILNWAGKPGLRAEMAANARRRFERDYRADIAIDRWHDVLTDLVPAHQPADRPAPATGAPAVGPT